MLARRLQTGDRTVIDEIVRRYYDALFGYLLRLTGGRRALADDLLQETWIRMMRGIAQYQYPRPFKSWLYAIATNQMRNHYASAEMRHTDTVDDAILELPFDDHAIDSDLIADEDARQVARALAALPDFQREVIVLVYYSDFSLQDAADSLAIPLGTVKSRLSNGIARLRSMMKATEL